jgi:CheY-like chemotaxis protein
MTRILCLDDSLDVLNLLSLILPHSGYEVLTTTNGYEVLDILRTRSIDLLTQDMQDQLRPGIRRKILCQMIRDDESLRHIPIVIVSDYIDGGKQMVAKGYADAFVGKPMGLIELLDAIEEVLRQHSIPLAPEEARARVRNRQRRPGEVKP